MPRADHANPRAFHASPEQVEAAQSVRVTVAQQRLRRHHGPPFMTFFAPAVSAKTLREKESPQPLAPSSPHPSNTPLRSSAPRPPAPRKAARAGFRSGGKAGSDRSKTRSAAKRNRTSRGGSFLTRTSIWRSIGDEVCGYLVPEGH